MDDYSTINYINHTKIGTIIEDYTAALNTIYPIGSIYKSINSTSPASFFGGTWEQIKGRFLIGQNSTYTAGSTGGNSQYSLTTANLPSHSHSISATRNSSTLDLILGGGWAGGGGSYAPLSHNGGASHSKLDDTTSSYQKMDSLTLKFSFSTKTTSNKGSSTALNTLPPYLAVYMWKRVA